MKQPNIIIFNPDEFRADGLSHLGFGGVSTPNLDEMVSDEAISFDSAFCQNPVCTPSRCSFMTGLYPHVYGHRTMEHMLHASNGEYSLLRILKNNGYYVWWGGKNDLIPGQLGWKNDADMKFEPSPEELMEKFGIKETINLHKDDAWRGNRNGNNYYSFHAGEFDISFPDFCDSDWINICGALDFIENHDSNKPFVMFLPLRYPHPPYGVEKDFMKNIDRNRIRSRKPEIFDNEFGSKAEILKVIRKLQNKDDWTENMYRDMRATYYGMCARIDYQFGLIRDKLKERNLWDDSMLFFLSDHGDYAGDYGLSEKNQNTFEDSITNVPFIVKMPKSSNIQRHGISHALVELTDMTATIYDYTGIKPPYWTFGKSLRPILEGSTDENRDFVFSEGGRLRGETSADEHNSYYKFNPPEKGLYYPRMQAQQEEEPILHGKATMIRTRDYKYIRRLYEEDELYDLTNDPDENYNQIRNPAYKDILHSLQLNLLQWYQETCDIVPFEQDKRLFQ